tara:strand:- start:1418 stop:1792 length:375 start_codon:yes stop_codon:yes gene_type:complete
MSDILTEVPRAFIEEFEDHINGTLPTEKVQVELRQQQLARIMAATGSVRMDGLGQQAARIDARLYFRLRQQHGCAPDHEWLPDYLADNRYLCSKGYRPKQNSVRHGSTFINGESVSKTKGRVQA